MRNWPTGDSEMAGRIRAFDWSSTTLGPTGSWPQSLRTMVELALASPVATVLLWRPSLFQIYNDPWRLLMSRKHPEALGKPTHESFPEIADTMAPLYERALGGEVVVLQNTLLPILRNGDVKDAWWNVHYLPVRDETGDVAGLFCTVVETTAGVLVEQERAAAVDALRSSEARFRAFVTASSDVVYRMSPDWSSMQQLVGAGFLADTHAPSRSWLMNYIPADERARVTAEIDAAIQAKSAFELEHKVIRADGAPGWTLSRAVPVLDEAGGIIEWLGSAKDVTEKRRTADRMAVMVAELQHRTRNLIAVVRSIADDTMEQTGPTEAFRPALATRLSALSRVQGLLSRAEVEPITMAAVVRLELDALDAHATGHQVVVAGPSVWLRNSAVQTLALALHELATNARKYGALSHNHGQLAVTWSERVLDGERRVCLEWVETGLDHAPGRTPLASQGGGYGRELIEQALPHALGAKTSYMLTETGVRCTIDLPSRSAAHDGERS